MGEVKRYYPFGGPLKGSNGGYDRQDYEDEALRLKHLAENKLTPTGRLKRSADPVRFKEMVNEVLTKLKKLKEDYPDGAERYDRWIGETEKMLTAAK